MPNISGKELEDSDIDYLKVLFEKLKVRRFAGGGYVSQRVDFEFLRCDDGGQWVHLRYFKKQG